MQPADREAMAMPEAWLIHRHHHQEERIDEGLRPTKNQRQLAMQDHTNS
jgi:hypothetical protein